MAYAKGKSDTIAKLDGTYKLPTKDQPEPSTEMTSVQQAVFGGGPSKSEAKPTQGQQDGQKGVKRGREEESDEDVAMDEDEDDPPKIAGFGENMHDSFLVGPAVRTRAPEWSAMRTL